MIEGHGKGKGNKVLHFPFVFFIFIFIFIFILQFVADTTRVSLLYQTRRNFDMPREIPPPCVESLSFSTLQGGFPFPSGLQQASISCVRYDCLRKQIMHASIFLFSPSSPPHLQSRLQTMPPLLSPFAHAPQGRRNNRCVIATPWFLIFSHATGIFLQIRRIQCIHSRFIYRNIKPDNFLMAGHLESSATFSDTARRGTLSVMTKLGILL